MPSPPVPRSLQIVAWLFFLSAADSILKMLVALFQNRISIQLGVLLFFVGLGLLRLNPRSLTWATVFTAISLFFLPVLAVLFLANPGQLTFYGSKLGAAPPGLATVFCLLLFFVAVWQYRVLTNPEIRRLFFPN